MNVIDLAAISVSDLLITGLTAAADATYLPSRESNRRPYIGQTDIYIWWRHERKNTGFVALFVAINTISIHSLALFPLSLKFKV